MLPLLPSSSYVRSQKFVREEWDAMFASNASTPAEKVEGGWKGVLYANLALIDPAASWNYFAQPNFDYSSIDGGASRTWYLAFAAGEFILHILRTGNGEFSRSYILFYRTWRWLGLVIFFSPLLLSDLSIFYI